MNRMITKKVINTQQDSKGQLVNIFTCYDSVKRIEWFEEQNTLPKDIIMDFTLSSSDGGHYFSIEQIDGAVILFVKQCIIETCFCHTRSSGTDSLGYTFLH